MICNTCKKEISEEYQLCKQIGSGSYSDIYLICNTESPKYIGKKLFNNKDSEFINCKNINNIKNVNFSKYIKTIGQIIIYQYIKGNNLEYLFYSMDFEYFNKIIKSVIKQLLELENQGYYYLDINKNNIIIKNDIPYLIDYGTLTHISKFNAANEKYFGSYGYVPPEFFLHKQIVPNKFDIFSIGIILFEKIYNFSPYSIGNYYHLKCFFWCKKQENHNINDCLIDFMNSQKNKKIGDGYKYFILKCLERDPTNRMNLTTANGLFQILIDR